MVQGRAHSQPGQSQAATASNEQSNLNQAFIVGVSASRTQPLPESETEARRLAELLESMTGFPDRIAPVLNPSKAELRKLLRDYAQQISQNGEPPFVVFAFSGHGVTVNDLQYLLCNGYNAEQPRAAVVYGISLSEVVDQLGQGCARALIIIDACRVKDDQTIQCLSDKDAVRPVAWNKVWVAYACRSGMEAYSGRHSFITHLIEARHQLLHCWLLGLGLIGVCRGDQTNSLWCAFCCSSQLIHSCTPGCL